MPNIVCIKRSKLEIFQNHKPVSELIPKKDGTSTLLFDTVRLTLDLQALDKHIMSQITTKTEGTPSLDGSILLLPNLQPPSSMHRVAVIHCW